VIVVDASVIASALIDDGTGGVRARDRLRGEQLVAPHLLDLEVASAWRRQTAAGRWTARRASLALADLRDLPVERASHIELLPRCWELRNNLTVYDATYVALAEALDVTLITSDRRLAQSTGIHCTIEMLA